MDGVGYRQNDIVPFSGEADGGVGEGVVMDTVVNDILSELYEDADDFSAKGVRTFSPMRSCSALFTIWGRSCISRGPS
jgi:hypothetical protein